MSGIIGTWDDFHRNPSIPQLLAKRQCLGLRPTRLTERIRHRKDPLDILSFSVAWNRQRMQNMILVVGPGTPADLLAKLPPSSTSSWSSSSSSEDSAGDDDDNDAEARGAANESNSDDEDPEDEYVMPLPAESEEESEDESRVNYHAMRHRGCINTAAWLNSGWRISRVVRTFESIETEECPSQLVTSGDDHAIKVWDVQLAMGSSSPLAGGNDTHCPFATSAPEEAAIGSKWARYYSRHKMANRHGFVMPLFSMQTGHRGNVFHVTPIDGKPGKIATCAADGYLLVNDIETSTSSMVISPECGDGDAGLSRLLSHGMCFSHHFLSPNTGLLCTQRGLRRFDLRLPPREQSTYNLLTGTMNSCKACVPWSEPATSSSLQEGETAYIFAGGTGSEVVLCDLRMADDISTSVVQRYCPLELRDAKDVSVSGLDLSRDKQELLVSYESDQIYTFPVFPDSRYSGGPSLDELNTMGSDDTVLPQLASYGGHLNRDTFLKNARYAGPRDEYICTGSDSGRAWIYEKATGAVVSLLGADRSTCNGVVPHPTLPLFITYGFDSTAKLWRATCPVDNQTDDSVLGRRKRQRETEYASSCTANEWDQVEKILQILETQGKEDVDVLPDQIFAIGNKGGPLLPFLKISNDLHNLPTILLENFYTCLEFWVQELPVKSGVAAFKNRLSLMRLRHQADRFGLSWNPSLPWQLGADYNEEDTDRVHPADLIPDCPSDWIPYDPEMSTKPWDFANYFNHERYGDFFRERYCHITAGSFVSAQQDLLSTPNWDPTTAEKELQSPSKTLPTVSSSISTTTWESETEHPGLVSASEAGGCSDVLESTAESCGTASELKFDASDINPTLRDKESREGIEREKPSEEETSNEVDSDGDDEVDDDDNSSEDEEDSKTDAMKERAHQNLYETMLLLKNAGNEALKEGKIHLAAQRYDKAIRYGAVATMSFPTKYLTFAKGRRDRYIGNGCYYSLTWDPCLKVLIVSRMNYALVLLKLESCNELFRTAERQAQLALLDSLRTAERQAQLALHELSPFCEARGEIRMGEDLQGVHSKEEPEETYMEASKLQAKAYFRLGNAQAAMGNYSEAASSFERSIASSKNTNTQPDGLVQKRLSEAKRKAKLESRNQRKKVKLGFSESILSRKTCP